MRLHWKLMLAYTAVVVMVVASVHLYMVRASRAFLVEQLGDTLAREARLAGDYLSRNLSGGLSPAAVDPLADLLGDRLDVRVTVIDGAGLVLGDSEVLLKDLAGLENHADCPEVQAAWRGRIGRSMRRSDTLEQEMLYVAGVVPNAGGGRLVMRLAMPLRDVQQIQGEVNHAIWMASLLGLGLALLLSYTLSQFISRPVAGMTRMARAVASGDFTGRTEAPGASSQELRELGRALNEMRRQIQDRIEQITVEKSRLEAVLASITEGILVVGAGGRVRMTNRAFEQLFGVTQPTAGRMPVELIRNGEVQEAIAQTLRSGEATSEEMTLSGVAERRFDVHVAPILQDGACIGAVTVFYDITELYRLERVRKDFVANVSHELRTPMTAIKGCADTLAGGALEDGEAAGRFVKMILTHAERLRLLLDDLLDLSRLESGRLELSAEAFPARFMVETAVEAVRQAAEEKGIGIDVDVPEGLEVRCDPKLIEQALINLLDNAVKYTPDGGGVLVVGRRLGEGEPAGSGRDAEAFIPTALPGAAGRLPRAEASRERQQRAVLEVIDTGIGIASDALPRVFERFYRVDKGRSRAMGGTGLGLSIVRHIVEAHGERVFARSELGRGSTFGFTLPVV